MRLEKDELRESERCLVAAGDEIRNMALKRKSVSESGSDVMEIAEEGTSNSAKKSCWRKEGGQYGDEITSKMLEQARLRSEMEQNRLYLEHERIEIERGRAEKEEERFAKLQENTKRRPGLDRKRLEVEVEERKQSLLERKKMIDVIEMLCKKLQ